MEKMGIAPDHRGRPDNRAWEDEDRSMTFTGYITKDSYAEYLKKKRDQTLEVEIKSGQLLISVGLDVLKVALENRPNGQISAYDEETGDEFYDEITDVDVFAEEILRALRSEEEDGSTVVHDMLDRACETAIENGAMGIKTKEDKLDDVRRARRKA